MTVAPRMSRWQLAAWVMLAGCVDPEGRYDDFIDRTAELRGRDAGPIDPGERFDWSGHYLLALSTVLSPDAPLLFEVEAEVSSDLAQIDLAVQPLTTDADEEPRTPVGEAIEVRGIEYAAGGTFRADLGEVSVPGRANPISGSDIVALVELAATARAAEGELPDLFCGGVSGQVVEPLELDLMGSTFGAVRTDDLESAEPLLRCPR